MLSLSALSEASRLRILAVGVTGYATLIASTAVQTYQGKAPLDLGLLTSALTLIGIGLLGMSGALALRSLQARGRPTAARSSAHR